MTEIENVRDEVLLKLRTEFAELAARLGQELMASPQECTLAGIQFAGSLLASFASSHAPDKHANNVTWGIRNLTGVYAQVMGIESNVLIHEADYGAEVPKEKMN